jgi:hypothetical protein
MSRRRSGWPARSRRAAFWSTAATISIPCSPGPASSRAAGRLARPLRLRQRHPASDPCTDGGRDGRFPSRTGTIRPRSASARAGICRTATNLRDAGNERPLLVTDPARCPKWRWFAMRRRASRTDLSNIHANPVGADIEAGAYRLSFAGGTTGSSPSAAERARRRQGDRLHGGPVASLWDFEDKADMVVARRSRRNRPDRRGSDHGGHRLEVGGPGSSSTRRRG